MHPTMCQSTTDPQYPCGEPSRSRERGNQCSERIEEDDDEDFDEGKEEEEHDEEDDDETAEQ